MTAETWPRVRVPKVTVEEYAVLPEREGVVTELLDGVVFEVQFPTKRHVQVARRLIGILREQQRAHGWPGEFLSEHFGVELVPGLRETVVGPDIALLSQEQIEAAGPEDYFPGPPVLAVEVRSTNDRARMIARKLSRYQEAGAPLVWVVDPRPRRRSVAVYALGDEGEPADPRVLGGDATLDGGDVLPGLAIPLPALWRGIP
jgi:Uma2 family endonuclease